jgi:hypothetical protein
MPVPCLLFDVSDHLRLGNYKTPKLQTNTANNKASLFVLFRAGSCVFVDRAHFFSSLPGLEVNR